MNKYASELIGTFVLTLFGCGSAAIAGAALGTLGIAFAFGLSIVAMAYAIGDISGCHINPAVSFGMLLAKRMSVKDFFGYVAAQVIGACIASGVLAFIITNCVKLGDYTKTGLGQNGFDSVSAVGLSCSGAIIVEIILTFVFVMVVLGVTSDNKTSHLAGLVIGLSLTFVHIMGIPLTGTSVNPARSLAPALVLGPNSLAFSQVWVFIVAPLIGGALAAVVWRALHSSNVVTNK
ncbi:MAG: MIP family channel protein [Megasphaera sp.]|jgi:aquaporin Z|nr:MIP family channel protein [Megasphaera sp.]